MPYEPAGAPVSRRDLAAELRHLLLAAERRPGAPGRLKRSALARRLGVSASSLYAYLDGTTLPPAGVLARLLDALDVAEGERQRLASVRDSLDARRRSRTQPHRLDPMVPRHLPADVPGFTGRAAYLDRLDALLPRRGSGASTVVITAISGTAGVGKTALAVHWAHRVADRFPDGQLYVNLRGFHPTGSPVDPAVAVRGFLDALQVPPQRLPVSSEAQSALYRSLLAGRRMLVLLDNARDAEQVRPLLPGTPGCMVLVTSRNELSGLVAAEGARPLAVDLLTRAEARQMLEHRLGQHRLAAEPAAVDEIIARCARLPLALAIVAARAGIRATFPLAMLAAQLREAHGGLGEFADDDAIADLRAVFSWSYHSLGPAAARLFRQMGLHPGPDIAAPAAASLAGVPAKEGRALLTELARAHLVTEHSPGRYTLHDLLRAYAGELARAMDSEADRRQAVHRMLDHYLHTAHRAALLLDPSRDPIALDTLRPGVSPEHLVDPERALAWFTAEHAVLISAVGTAAAAGRDIHTWQLSWTLATYLYRRGHNHDLVETQDAAVAAGHRLADPSVRARAHRELALAYTQLGRYGDAYTHAQLALDAHRQAGVPVGQANAHLTIGFLYAGQGRHAEAIDHAQHALDLFESVGHRRGQADASNAIGWYSALLGDYQRTLAQCHKALAFLDGVGDRDSQAATWDSIGYAHHHLGRYAQAIACYRHGLDALRPLGNRYLEATILTHLGDAHRADNAPDSAREAWRQALHILEELGHADADAVRGKLAVS